MFVISAVPFNFVEQFRQEVLQEEPEDAASILPEDSYEAGQVIVSFKDDVNQKQALEFAERHSLKEDLREQDIGIPGKTLFSEAKVKVYDIPEGKSVPKTLRLLKKDPRVEHAEPNCRMHAMR